MIKTLVHKLGRDRIGDLVADEAKRVQVEVLREEREVRARMIAKLNERIAGFGGKRRGRPRRSASAVAATPTPTRKPRRRKSRVVPRPDETLKDFVLKALAKAGGPLNVSTLVDLVLEAGYKTNAKRSTLVTSIYTVLADKKLFSKMGKGVFALIAAPATRRSSRRPSPPRSRRCRLGRTRPLAEAPTAW